MEKSTKKGAFNEKSMSVRTTTGGEEKTTRPVSFRPTEGTLRKIETLEKARQEPRAAILKEAVDTAYNLMIFNKMNSSIFQAVREIFGDAEVLLYNFLKGSTAPVSNQGFKKNPFEQHSDEQNACITVYKLRAHQYKHKEKNVSFNLSMLNIRIEFETSQLVKLRVTKPEIVIGNISELQPALYIKIMEILSKRGFQTETRTDTQEMALDLFFEHNASVEPSAWIAKFKQELKLVKKAVSDIENALQADSTIKREQKEMIPNGDGTNR